MEERLFNIFLQRPKPAKKPLQGTLSVHDGTAMVFEGTNCIRELVKCELEHMSSSGLFLRGFEDNGTDRQGTPRFVYQEWWCVFV